ncbi:MAG TPA: type II toxin-antitoxin system VapC family toxin [Thermomicrobiales bacterium]|nr:type II toxin-antitoxin system VapC family toxin [Thermomicrobiales bacterium]
MIVVDASVWVSALMPRERHHIQSRQWFERWNQQDQLIIAPILAVSEVAGAIARRTGTPEDGRAAATDLFAAPSVHLVPLDEHLGRDTAMLAADLSLRGADATYVAVAQRFDVPLLTWDHDQAARAEVAIPVQAPEER